MSDNSATLSFVQHFNHVCSKMEWRVVSDDYDYNQEIATSCYGDMLHDTERNQKFALALKKAIEKMHRLGKKAHVLDIGTGTGLLSMLAVKYGADSVVACEAFSPMANCAVKIIEKNNFSDSIKVVMKHSTALTVGEHGDLKHRANILVSEVFDTELIGEGAIKTFNHAHEFLLEEECIVIPSAGNVYAQVIDSDLAASWNRVRDWKDGDKYLVRITDEIKKCPGAASVHDIQLSQLRQTFFKPLTECVPIFRFDWSAKTRTPAFRHYDADLRTTDSGKAQVIFMWWDLTMDPEGEIVLSCAPVWVHPDAKGDLECPKGNPARCIPWRDHWMQAVYFLNEDVVVNRGDSITLNCYHDEFSFWFALNATSGERRSDKRPVCECGVHFLVSRTRVGAMNCERRRDIYLRNLKEMVKADGVYVVFGDVSFLGLVIASLGARKVYILETSPPMERIVASVAEHNALANVAVRGTVSQIAEDLTAAAAAPAEGVTVVSEPFFRNSVLPWDNLAFWYLKQDLLDSLRSRGVEVSPAGVSPRTSKMRACAVQFDDLWKIARRLNACEGLNMEIFDDLIEAAKDKAESYVEPQPLWEYPGVALTPPFDVLEFEFSEDVPSGDVAAEGRVEFASNCRCDGVAVWMEYCIKDDSWLGTGPDEKIMVNEYISWDMFERQGVHLFRNSRTVHQGDALTYEVAFKPESGEFNFTFNVTSGNS